MSPLACRISVAACSALVRASAASSICPWIVAVRSASAFLANGVTFQNSSPKIVIAAAPPKYSSYPSGHNQWWVRSMCSSSSAAAMSTLSRLIVRPPRS